VNRSGSAWWDVERAPERSSEELENCAYLAVEIKELFM